MPPLRPLAPPRCLASSRNFAPLLSTNTTATTRPLSTTPHPHRQTPTHRTVPKDLVPAYPYGPFRTYKQRNEGLFGRSKIRFGNTVSEDYDRKARATWLPNKHTKRLWSASLGAFVRTRLTASVLRTVDRLGGIDEYLLGGKRKRIRELGPAGWALRWKIMQTPAVRERFAREREAMGVLPVKVEGEGMMVLGPGSDAETNAKAVRDMVDQMIARDEEFVLGPEEEHVAVPESESQQVDAAAEPELAKKTKEGEEGAAEDAAEPKIKA